MSRKKKNKAICRQCGKCCTDLEEAADNYLFEKEAKVWIDAGREDILDYTKRVEDEDADVGYEIWFSPKTGRKLERCPWIRKLPNKNVFICRINDIKPSHCRAFKPGSKVAKVINGRCTHKRYL